MAGFDPHELRDANGRWTVGGLVKHGISVVKHSNGHHSVHFNGNTIGHVHASPGRGHTAHGPDRTRVSKATHASVAEAAAHVAAQHFTEGPRTKAWVEPPTPEGKKGQRKAGGLTAVGITNTELGDKVEQALQEVLGFEDAHPGRRQGRFDLLYDGHAYEVKAVSQSATEYKAKPKGHEIAEKKAYAEENNLKPHIMIVVYNPKEGKLYVYSKDGVGAYRLTGPGAGWKFHGTVPINLGSNWDPVNPTPGQERV